MAYIYRLINMNRYVGSKMMSSEISLKKFDLVIKIKSADN